MKKLFNSLSIITFLICLIGSHLFGQTDIVCHNCLQPKTSCIEENRVIACLYSEIKDQSILNKLKNYKTISPQYDGRMTATTIFDEFVILDCNFEVTSQLNYEFVDDYSQGRAIIRKNNLEGFIDWTGNEVIPFIYQSTQPFSEKYAAVKKDGKWGYISRDGETFIDFIYSSAGNFQNGIAVVELNNKFGVLNAEGRLVLPVKYERIEINYNKVFVRESEKEGIFDLAGNNVLPVSYDYISIIRNNLAKINEGQNSGLINLNGNIEFPLSNKEINIVDTNTIVFYSDSNTIIINYAKKDTIVLNDGNFTPISENYFSYNEGAFTGVVDKNRTAILKPIFDQIIRINDNFLTKKENKLELYDPNFKLISKIYTSVESAGWNNALIANNGAKFGVIESSGQIIIPFIYDRINHFNTQLLQVYEDEYYGLIDTNLNLKLPVIYNSNFETYTDNRFLLKGIFEGDELNNFETIIDSSGVAIIIDAVQKISPPGNGMMRTEKNGKSGYYDINGKLVIPFVYNAAGDFHDGLAYISDSTNAYIDRHGNKKIDLGSSREILNYSLNMGYSIIQHSDSSYGLLNKNGNYLIPGQCDTITAFSEENYSLFSQNKKYGIVDAFKGIIVQPKYNLIGNLNEGLFRVKLDDKYGFIDRNGKVIIPLIYDSADEFAGGRTNVVLRGISFSIDLKGDVIPR